MATSTEYAIGVGFGLAAGSLTALTAITQLRWQGRFYDIKALSPNRFPNDIVMSDGSVRGDGVMPYAWLFGIIPRAGLVHLIDTYMTVSSATVKSAKVTIQTYAYDEAAWLRFNAEAILPVSGTDYEDYFGAILNLNWRFNLVAQL